MLHCRLRNAGRRSSAQRRADAITEIPQKASLIPHATPTDDTPDGPSVCVGLPYRRESQTARHADAYLSVRTIPRVSAKLTAY